MMDLCWDRFTEENEMREWGDCREVEVKGGEKKRGA